LLYYSFSFRTFFFIIEKLISNKNFLKDKKIILCIYKVILILDKISNNYFINEYIDMNNIIEIRKNSIKSGERYYSSKLSYDIDSKESMVYHYNVSSDDGRTITSLNDAYLVYSSLIKNAKFYDSITKEEIEATVVVSEKKDSSANFNYTISAQGYDTISGTVVFDYSTIGILTNDNGFNDASFNVTLPSDFTVKLSDVSTIVASRTYVVSEETSLSYQAYYSIDEGKTWTTVSPKITEAGEYDVYTLYCFTEKGNCATSLIEDDLLNQISQTTLSASGNFIIAIQHITVVE
jgi:hypothetical protein